jgi:(p)ppGpp synthase/HD superfamily hydrolase
MAKDIRTIVIKFADRIHNLQTQKYQPPQRPSASPANQWKSTPRSPAFGVGRNKRPPRRPLFSLHYPQEHAWVKSLIKDSLKRKEKTIERLKKY